MGRQATRFAARNSRPGQIFLKVPFTQRLKRAAILVCDGDNGRARASRTKSSRCGRKRALEQTPLTAAPARFNAPVAGPVLANERRNLHFRHFARCKRQRHQCLAIGHLAKRRVVLQSDTKRSLCRHRCVVDDQHPCRRPRDQPEPGNRLQWRRAGNPVPSQTAAACSRRTTVVGAPATSLTTVKSNLIRANGALSPASRISLASLTRSTGGIKSSRVPKAKSS
jgi:hypothetical protein